MNISLIAALSKNLVIGSQNKIPWHLPADLKHFKALTLNKSVIMGRKTFESIGKPLPQRRNIVITRNVNYVMPGIETAVSLDAALEKCSSDPEIMIIGGAQIYQQAINLANRLYLTFIDMELEGDAFFPEIDYEAWKVLEKQTFHADATNPWAYHFVTLTRGNSLYL